MGGAHDHFGLILSSNEYTQLSTILYEKLSQPGLLIMPEATTHHEAVCLCKDHNEKLLLFCTTVNIKNILKSQIMQAIDKVHP